MLDIDMDFFLDDIPYFITGNERLNEEYYTPWNEKEFRDFLENKCKLSKVQKIPGRIITHHDQAFDFWKELIGNGRMHLPFEVTHIDSHSDLGLGDGSWFHLATDFLHYPINERINFLPREKVMLSNYLAYTIACGWISKVNFVHQNDWDFNDFVSILLQEFNDESYNFEFKAFEKGLDAGKLVEEYRELAPVKTDSLVPYEIFRKDDFSADEKFDALVFCQSPQYTPASSDYMLGIIKEYIIEI